MKRIVFIIACCLITIFSFSQIRELDSLHHLLSTTKEDTIKVMVLARLSFYDQSFEHGLQLAEEGLALARKIGYERGEGQCLHQIGNQYQAASIFNLSLHYYIEALKIREKIGDVSGLGRSYSGIGSVYEAQQDYTHALYYYYRSLNLLGKINDNYLLAIQNQNIGNLYLTMTKYDSSLFYYQRSYEYFNSTPDKYQLSTTLNGLGAVQFNMGNSSLASEYYRLAIRNGIVYSDSSSLPISYFRLAQIFEKTKQPDSSIIYAKQALLFAQMAKQQSTVIEVGKLLSELYKNKDDNEALRYLHIAMAARDSTFSTEKGLQIQNLSFSEREREREIAENKLKEEEQRKHNLQYAAIAIGLISFVILFLALSRSVIVKTGFIEFFGVLGLLALFEFINLFIHPYLARITNESPVLMLVILIAIGALLIPLHHRLEKWITDRMVEKNKNIRLAAAKQTIAKLEGGKKEEGKK